MSSKVYYANDTILLGDRGAIQRGEEVPTSFGNSLGEQEDTNFDRLKDLHLVSTTKPKDAPAAAEVAEEPAADAPADAPADDAPSSDTPKPVNYASLNHDQLEAEAKQRGLDVKRIDGGDGAIRNQDYVKALEQDDIASND